MGSATLKLLVVTKIGAESGELRRFALTVGMSDFFQYESTFGLTFFRFKVDFNVCLKILVKIQSIFITLSNLIETYSVLLVGTASFFTRLLLTSPRAGRPTFATVPFLFLVTIFLFLWLTSAPSSFYKKQLFNQLNYICLRYQKSA